MQNNEKDLDILESLDIDSHEIERKEEKGEIQNMIKIESEIDTIDTQDSDIIFFEEGSNTKGSGEEEKKPNQILKGIAFLLKYALTSTLIFGILMVSTNYSAYLNIAKGYIYKEKIETESKGIISSVEALNIKEKIKEKKIEEGEKKTQEEEKPSEYSINKIIASANKKDIDLDIEITPYHNRIVIPKIAKNIPLVDIKNRKIEGEEELNDIFMEELENGVIRYPGSAKPGNDGTTFVFGHSSNFPWIEGDYNDVFARLDNVVYNDEIIVYYGQKKYKYRIREKKVIKPGDVSVLKRNKNKSELTLMTCWPIGTTLKRLVVTGELVEEV